MRHFLSVLLLLLGSVHAHAAVTGRVIDEAGKPLRGARIRARALETSEQMYARLLSSDPQPAILATAETNESGAFRIDTKSNAVVELILDAPGRQLLAQEVADGDDNTFLLRSAPMRRGRVTAGGKGVANATVILGRLYATRTDAEGRYEVPEPGAGLEWLTVIHRDYAIAERGLRQRPRGEMSFDVALQSGTAVRGRVVDLKGEGVAGAVVRAAGWSLARSGEDGSFEIAHVPERASLSAREANRVGSLNPERTKPPYVIRLRPAAVLRGSVRSTKDDTAVIGARVTLFPVLGENWPMTFAISDAKGNVVIDGLESGTKRMFAMHPAFFDSVQGDVRLEDGERVDRAIALKPFSRLAGKVIDDEQKPIAGATVSQVGLFFPGTTTAPDGTFSLRVSVLERPPSISVAEPRFPQTTFGPYELEVGETKSGLQLRMPRGVDFELRLVDREAKPIAGEPLNVFSADADRSMRRPISCKSSECRTDEQGRLMLKIVEGTFDIDAGGEATVRRELRNQTLTARTSPMTIEIDRGATVEGRVVWSDGTPANVRGMVTSPAMRIYAPVIDGAFSLRNVPVGKLTLTVNVESPVPIQSQPVEVTAPATGVALMLPRPGRIEGRVFDRATEKPVTEFMIQMQQTGMRVRSLPPRGFQDDNGRFVIEEIGPGTYDVSVQATGYVVTNSATVTVEEGGASAVSVPLDRGGVVTGRVTSEGRPLADASLFFVYEQRGSGRGNRTDANGEFRVQGAPPGVVTLQVQREGYVSKSVNVTVAAEGETRADIEMERGRELRVHVIDSVGKPIANVQIWVRTGGASMGNTGADGSYKLSGLGGGTYTIEARKEGYVDAKTEVNPSAAGDVTITLSRGGTITGRILGVAPADLPFVTVHGFGGSSRATPDSSGAFTINGVPDGDVVITANTERPRSRSVYTRAHVVNGSAPPVELDFGAGISVRGRVTLRGRNVEGYITFNPISRMPNASSAGSQIDSSGMYEVRVAGAGDYPVGVARSDGRGFVTASKVTVAGEMVHDIELRGATVSGVVRDAVTRQPLGSATVEILPGYGTRTNGAGQFTFDVVGDGNYRLRVSAPGYAPEVRSFAVAGDTQELESLLSRGQPVQFRIVDASTGQPADVVSVSVMDASKFPIYSGNPPPDATGMRTITLNPGTYTLGAMAQNAAATVTLTVPGPPLVLKLERKR